MNESLTDNIERLTYVDCEKYLPNNILTKVDRAAMYCGLETRIPLLDHRLLEYIWSFPGSMRFDSNKPKKELREIRKKLLGTNEHTPGVKKGFGMPLANLLRTELREWAYDLVNSASLRDQETISHKLVAEELETHMSGRKNREYQLWPILMLQSWREYRKY